MGARGVIEIIQKPQPLLNTFFPKLQMFIFFHINLPFKVQFSSFYILTMHCLFDFAMGFDVVHYLNVIMASLTVFNGNAYCSYT